MINKQTRAFGECLGTKRRRRTWHSAKSCGETRAVFDPQVSEWGNPPFFTVSLTEYIGLMKRTRGTETSKYPKERKSKETPLVVANERGLAQ